MIFLIGSVVFTSFLAIALKVCDKMGINTFQAIIFNYLTCVLTGLVINNTSLPADFSSGSPWIPWAMIMGLFFIIFFNLTALTVKNNGVAVTAVATKLSLVIPFIFSIFLYNEGAGLVKIIGIALALLAVVLTCYRSSGSKSDHRPGMSSFILPAIVFMGTGALDTIIKYTEQKYVTDESRDVFLITCFAVAFLTGGLFYAAQLAMSKIRFEPKAIVAGIVIGIPNYLSIWCLIRALKVSGGESSVILPINNIGIVLLSAIVAWHVFKEKLSLTNLTGIALAVLSIFLISLDF